LTKRIDLPLNGLLVKHFVVSEGKKHRFARRVNGPVGSLDIELVSSLLKLKRLLKNGQCGFGVCSHEIAPFEWDVRCESVSSLRISRTLFLES
jgi:hypothetical protein